MTVPLEDASPDEILEVGHAFRASRALLSAVELGVFSALADGPLALEPLRCQVGLDARASRDFLDTLVALGMLSRDADGHYANSAAADLYLDGKKPTYVGSLLERMGKRDFAAWASLTTALRTGQPQYDQSVVKGFAPLYADETTREMYASGMTVRTRPVAKSLAKSFPWSNYRTLIDIGGAQGCLAVEIALAHPHITGGTFDLPALAPSFDGYVQRFLLSDRLRFYPGDFFHGSLPGADVLVLGRVLHNWQLATKKMLLRKAYDALPIDGALIVYERLIDDERRVNATALLSSLQMLLTSPGGFDFSGADCTAWMGEVGFRKIRVEPLTAEQSMIVGIK